MCVCSYKTLTGARARVNPILSPGRKAAGGEARGGESLRVALHVMSRLPTYLCAHYLAGNTKGQ